MQSIANYESRTSAQSRISPAQIALRLTGPLDPTALRTALAMLASNHETLRAGPAGASRVLPAGSSGQRDFSLPLLDLSAEPRDIVGADEVIRTILIEESLTEFRPEAGEVFRCWLVRISPVDHVLSLVLDRETAEQCRAELLFRELPALYAAAQAGRGRYVSAGPQDERADRAHGSATLQDQLAYWRTRIADSRPLKLAAGNPESADLSGRTANLDLAIPEASRYGLHAAAHQIGAGIPTLVLGIFAALLGRHTRQDVIVLGVPVPPRYRCAPIRVDLSGDPRYAGIIKQVQTELTAAAKHSNGDIGALIEALEMASGPSRRPLFQVMFDSFVAGEGGVAEEHGRCGAGRWNNELSATVAYADTALASSDLALIVSGTADRLKARLRYRADLFSECAINGIACHLTALLSAIADDAGRSFPEFPVITHDEYRELVR